MKKTSFILRIIPWPAACCWLLISCHPKPPKTDIARNVHTLNEHIEKDISSFISFFSNRQGKIWIPGMADSTKIYQPAAVRLFYKKTNYHAAWSDTGRLFPQADSMISMIRQSADDGLYPAWYHFGELNNLLHQLKPDSAARWDAVKWSAADILLTDAFMRLANNLHYGLLPPDSISLKKDSAYTDSALTVLSASALRKNNIITTLDSLRPDVSQYRELSQALHQYRQQYMHRHWDTLPLKYTDTLLFKKLLVKRLLAGEVLDSANMHSDAAIKNAIKDFQRSHALYPDGVAGKRTINALNRSKTYRLRQIAVNLERWRHVGDNRPDEYIWVNIPSYTLKVWNHDTVVIQSRIITGKPGHETPLLNSYVTNFQLYPYWRVPISIIAKEMLPSIRKDTGYLRKHNLEVVDRHNNVVDASKLNWKKYNQHYFPYVIRQMTGLDNSLGIIKFNFKNKYSVYLHDTNLRNLFNLTHRDISHGCVRVQQWEPLAMYLIRNDTLRHIPDSVSTWITNQQQKWVSLSTRVPVYIRYFTCDVNSKGKLTFYEDIYGYDSVMMKKIFH
jgi:murein L,D-transpeptidase YcbB/YkuD